VGAGIRSLKSPSCGTRARVQPWHLRRAIPADVHLLLADVHLPGVLHQHRQGAPAVQRAAYQQVHNQDDLALSALLGCAPDVLTQLRLACRPGAALSSRTAADDVVEIAARFGLDAAALRRILADTAEPAS
jgi:hypothetical protein